MGWATTGMSTRSRSGTTSWPSLHCRGSRGKSTALRSRDRPHRMSVCSMPGTVSWWWHMSYGTRQRHLVVVARKILCLRCEWRSTFRSIRFCLLVQQYTCNVGLVYRIYSFYKYITIKILLFMFLLNNWNTWDKSKYVLLQFEMSSRSDMDDSGSEIPTCVLLVWKYHILYYSISRNLVALFYLNIIKYQVDITALQFVVSIRMHCWHVDIVFGWYSITVLEHTYILVPYVVCSM